MPADERYLRQVGLLVRVLPLVADEECFALKGGTAINLFVKPALLVCCRCPTGASPRTVRRSRLAERPAGLRLDGRLRGPG